MVKIKNDYEYFRLSGILIVYFWENYFIDWRKKNDY